MGVALKRFSDPRMKTFKWKAGVLILAWMIVAGGAMADTVTLTDDMEVRPSPLHLLLQALEPDLDDLRQMVAVAVITIPIILPGIPMTSDARLAQVHRAASPSDPHGSPLYQRLSTYRI
jgi:hypothetical protein